MHCYCKLRFQNRIIILWHRKFYILTIIYVILSRLTWRSFSSFSQHLLSLFIALLRSISSHLLSILSIALLILHKMYCAAQLNTCLEKKNPLTGCSAENGNSDEYKDRRCVKSRFICVSWGNTLVFHVSSSACIKFMGLLFGKLCEHKIPQRRFE